jgi:hypothetical protein
VSEPVNDTHTTDGEHYRTPAHPLLISALGRAVWNFLSLEETVVAILYEAGTHDLGEARSMMAGAKAEALRRLGPWLRQRGASHHLVSTIEVAYEAFDLARSEYRNALLHASPFTAGYEEDGTYRPGLAMTTPSGLVDARAPLDLHSLAHRIEDAIDPLSAARMGVGEFVESSSD